MEKMLSAKASIQIQKPIEQVFEAIINPMQMNHYFIEHGSGRLQTGTTIQWKFPEFDGQFPVTGKQIRHNEYISFDWSGGSEGMLVEIHLETYPNNSTVVRITEQQMPVSESGIQQAIGQTEGWANFLACLKAYLEYGINLRTGAFDFMKKTS